MTNTLRNQRFALTIYQNYSNYFEVNKSTLFVDILNEDEYKLVYIIYKYKFPKLFVDN